MKTIRTFVAVEASPAVRQAAGQLIGQLRQSPAVVKWVEPENMHLTLKFLGDVDPRQIHEVCSAVQRATEKVASFELEVRGAGAFPNVRRPGTIWLGAGEGDEQMAALFRPIEKALERLGFRREPRRFHAHLTLGRARRGGPGVEELGELLGRHADYQAGRMTVRQATVFSSRLGPEGPTYEVLGHARLAGKSG